MPLFHGVLPAIVVDNVDPLGQGRVKVRLNARLPPRHPGELWMRVATLMAGDRRGSWFMPDIDDEVLVAFDANDPTLGYVVGALWSDAHTPPEPIQAGNYRKVLRSRNGVEVALDDQDGQESFVVKTPGGQKMMLRDGPGSVEISDSNGNSLRLEASGITVTSSATVQVQASTVKISCGMLTVNSGMSKFSGVVQCDTMISNSVVSASYTPGAGNIQ